MAKWIKETQVDIYGAEVMVSYRLDSDVFFARVIRRKRSEGHSYNGFELFTGIKTVNNVPIIESKNRALREAEKIIAASANDILQSVT